MSGQTKINTDRQAHAQTDAHTDKHTDIRTQTLLCTYAVCMFVCKYFFSLRKAVQGKKKEIYNVYMSVWMNVCMDS